MTKSNRYTQSKRLLDYLKKYKTITNYEAISELSILSNSSRIAELRKQGYKISDRQEVRTNALGEKVYIKRYIYEGEIK